MSQEVKGRLSWILGWAGVISGGIIIVLGLCKAIMEAAT